MTQRPGEVYFSDDFNDGRHDVLQGPHEAWWSVHQHGGKAEIIDAESVLSNPEDWVDAQGNPRGMVAKYTVTGQAVQIPGWGDAYWRAIYPDWTNDHPIHTLNAPCGIQVDVWIRKGHGNVGLLGVHRLNEVTGDRNSVAALAVYPGDRVELLVRDGNGNDIRVNCTKGLFRSDKWNTVRMDFLPDGRVIPYINGYVAIPNVNNAPRFPQDDYPPGFADAHAGFQKSSSTADDEFAHGDFILNDNFTIFDYSE